jgi:serine/threonine-protein kinase
LLAPLASGGMGDVWIAAQEGSFGFSHVVALKTIRQDHARTASFRKMFLEEARLASRLHHVNVVEVLDLGEQDGMVFQAMPLIEGDSLAGLGRRARESNRGRLPCGCALRILVDALRGLHAAHELTDDDGVCLQVVHRDVSPQNVLVGLDGIARLTDFGIAKALGRLSDETESGQLRGKLSYLSPEQAVREAPDRRSDVFAAGVVLWEALTGERLFKGLDVIETLEKVRALETPDPREVAPDVPAEAAGVALRALARDPRDRFASAEEMADALEAVHGIARSADVAALVRELAGSAVAERRAKHRRWQTTASGGPPAQPAPPDAPTVVAVAVSPTPSPGPRRWRTVVAVTAACVAIAAVAFVRVRGAAHADLAPARPAASSPLPAGLAAAPAAAGAVAAASPDVPAPGAAIGGQTSAPTSSSAPGVSPTGARPPPPASHAAPRRTPTSAPPSNRPPFGNPYDR